MKTYLSLFRVRFLNNLQYRGAALGGLTTQVFWGLMLVFIYAAFYRGGNGNIPFSALVSIVWLQQAFLAFVFLYDWDDELITMITNGGISYELCRPVHLYPIWYMKLLSKRAARGLLRFAPIIVLGFCMPAPYTLMPPDGPVAFVLFLVSMSLGLLLICAMSMLIYISIFKTLSPSGSIGIITIIGEFFSGLTIPIPLMPDWLQRACEALPFRYVADLPFRVYTGLIGTANALTGIGLQILWIVILVALGAYCMHRVSKLSVVQGG